METYNDVYRYLCSKGYGRAIAQFYVQNPNEVAKAFWNGVLTTLEVDGKITSSASWNIWKEITGEG
jgi:hypothetical protein